MRWFCTLHLAVNFMFVPLVRNRFTHALHPAALALVSYGIVVVPVQVHPVLLCVRGLLFAKYSRPLEAGKGPTGKGHRCELRAVDYSQRPEAGDERGNGPTGGTEDHGTTYDRQKIGKERKPGRFGPKTASLNGQREDLRRQLFLLFRELELQLIHSHMTQKTMLRGEVYSQIGCAQAEQT